MPVSPAEQDRVLDEIRKAYNALSYLLGGDGPKSAGAQHILTNAKRFEAQWRAEPNFFRGDTARRWFRTYGSDLVTASALGVDLLQVPKVNGPRDWLDEAKGAVKDAASQVAIAFSPWLALGVAVGVAIALRKGRK